jgi:hypothetical protein
MDSLKVKRFNVLIKLVGFLQIQSNAEFIATDGTLQFPIYLLLRESWEFRMYKVIAR